MRFRFGWRREQKDAKDIYKEYEEDTQSEALNEIASSEAENSNTIVVNCLHDRDETMTTRIILLGDQEEISGLYSLYLRSKGYEVFHFSSPSSCSLLVEQKCTCPRDYLCADIIITQMDMAGMSGLELIRHQNEKGCHALPENKAIIFSEFTSSQEHQAKALGCKIMQKPFRLVDLMNWVNECEKRIPAKRELTPLDELLEAA